jgi:hypothetical protein
MQPDDELVELRLENPTMDSARDVVDLGKSRRHLLVDHANGSFRPGLRPQLVVDLADGREQSNECLAQSGLPDVLRLIT